MDRGLGIAASHMQRRIHVHAKYRHRRRRRPKLKLTTGVNEQREVQVRLAEIRLLMFTIDWLTMLAGLIRLRPHTDVSYLSGRTTQSSADGVLRGWAQGSR